MRKTIKILLLATLACLLLPACSCGVTSIEELLPSLSEYAEWDGNYMYRGNMRVKTTGEDEELLIPSLTYNGINYTFEFQSEPNTYSFADDNTLFLLLFAIPEEFSENDSSQNQQEQATTQAEEEQTVVPMLIKYQLKEKNYEILHVFQTEEDTDLYLIRANADYAIISSSSNKQVYIYDIVQKNMKEFVAEKKEKIEILNDCLFFIDKTTISYARYCDGEKKHLLNRPDSTAYTQVIDVKISGFPLIKIEDGLNITYFYLQNNKIYTPEIFKTDRQIRVVSDEYLILGDKNDPFNNEFYDYYISNCELYKLSFVNDVFSYQKQLSFKKGFGFEKSYVLKDGFLGFRFVTGISPLREVRFYKNYVYDPNKNELTTLTFEEELHERIASNTISQITCGDLVYYFERITIGTFGMGPPPGVYKLKSRNTATGEEKLLQAFARNYGDFSHQDLCRFSKTFFGPNDSDEILTFFGKGSEYYIKILPY